VSDHSVIIGGRSHTAVEATMVELGASKGFVADLAIEDEVGAAASAIEAIDLLVHCAGVLAPIGVPVREAWRHVMEVNVLAAVQLTELLLPLLRLSAGRIVFINSGAGLRAMGTDGYSASKFALTSYADALRQLEAPRVRVISVHPGRIDTDMQRELQSRAGHVYRPEEYMTVASVARSVRHMIDAPDDVACEALTIRPRTAPTA